MFAPSPCIARNYSSNSLSFFASKSYCQSLPWLDSLQMFLNSRWENRIRNHRSLQHWPLTRPWPLDTVLLWIEYLWRCVVLLMVDFICADWNYSQSWVIGAIWDVCLVWVISSYSLYIRTESGIFSLCNRLCARKLKLVQDQRVYMRNTSDIQYM